VTEDAENPEFIDSRKKNLTNYILTQMQNYTIDPNGSKIHIDIQELRANSATCRVTLFDDQHHPTELTDPEGSAVPWSFVLQEPPSTYKNYEVACNAYIVDPNPSPGDVYLIQLSVSQPPGKPVSDTTNPSPAPFDATGAASATLDIILV
jgi:hypothetical protein